MSFQLNRLTPDLWVGQSRLFSTNSGVFLSNGTAFLIDPSIYPDEIAAVADFLSAAGAEASALVLTHIHWDHILGPEHFPVVRVIAQERYLDQAAKHGAEIVADVAEWVEKMGVQRAAPFVIPLPDQTFEATLTLTVGELHLKLAHAPGHSPDMLVILHEESGTLWASDILSDIEIPGVADSLLSYERTLSMLSDWNLTALVPGHGTPTIDRDEIASRLGRDIAYLAELRSTLERAISAGKSLEEAQEMGDTISYWLPKENSYIHRSNVEIVYKELRGAVQ